MKNVYVVALTREEFNDYVDNNSSSLDKSYIFFHSPYQIRLEEEPEVVCYGRWRQRNNIEQLNSAVLSKDKHKITFVDLCGHTSENSNWAYIKRWEKNKMRTRFYEYSVLCDSCLKELKEKDLYLKDFKSAVKWVEEGLLEIQRKIK